MLGKGWVGSRHASGVLDGGVTLLRQQAGNREGHSNAMVSMAIQNSSLKLLATGNHHSVFELFNIGSHETKILGRGVDPIRFLDAKLSSIANRHLPLGQRTGDSKDWHFIDEIWNFFTFNFGSFKLTTDNLDITAGFATILMLDMVLNMSAHANKNVE